MSQKCRACGCPIEFIMGPNGKEIPVQKVRTIYYNSAMTPALRKAPPVFDDPDCGETLYVSHFETCSNPERFSKGEK